MRRDLRSSSVILKAAAQLLLPLLLLLSLFLLLRGHHEPGGGFIGGLVAASAIALHLFATDMRSARGVLRVDPRSSMGVGLLVALLAGGSTGGRAAKAAWTSPSSTSKTRAEVSGSTAVMLAWSR